ncbi:MAG: nucleotidyltransferase domain-containing protein [Nitrospirae bacterium]|nr:MAG: nucleotidyltransferase domain-containing protein [Nitrospirota bacterium]
MIRYKKLPPDIFQRIDSLTALFSGESNIIFAYLFGGLLKRRTNPLSDIDIAVFVKDTRKSDYLELFNKVTGALGTDEVDLIILNASPISLTGRIMHERKVLADKEPFLRHKYESYVLRNFFDFKIKEKAILERRYGIG